MEDNGKLRVNADKKKSLKYNKTPKTETLSKTPSPTDYGNITLIIMIAQLPLRLHTKSASVLHCWKYLQTTKFVLLVSKITSNIGPLLIHQWKTSKGIIYFPSVSYSNFIKWKYNFCHVWEPLHPHK